MIEQLLRELVRGFQELTRRVAHLEAAETPANATALQGATVSATAPAAGQMLVYDATTSTWTPAMGWGAPALLTIASGVITVTRQYHRVDTEGAAASDDLDTINGGVAGMLLVLQRQSNARAVTVRDNVGNIQLAGSANCVLNNVFDKLMLIYTPGNRWEEISRADNG
jgi:hypothetical protein